MDLALSQSTEWHTHDLFELVFCRGGSGNIVVENDQVELRSRRTVLIAADAGHRFCFGEDESAELKIICFTVADMVANLSPVQVLILSSIKKRSVAFVDYSELHTPLWEILNTMVSNEFIEEEYGRANVIWAVVGLFLSLYDRGRQQRKGSGRHSPTMKKICRWIDENPGEPGNIDAIAVQFGLSRSLLTREFRLHTNMSVVEYINMRRLQNAGSLLTTTDRDITWIALECGFPSVSNFYRKFKSLYGVTPTGFRNQLYSG